MRPLILALIGFILVGCTKHCGETTACGSFHAGNEQEARVVRDAIIGFLGALDFSPAADPGGMRSWSGLHTQGEMARWYRNPILIDSGALARVTEVSRRSGGADFHIDLTWGFRGTASEHKEARKRVREFYQDLAKQMREPNQSLQPTPGMRSSSILKSPARRG